MIPVCVLLYNAPMKHLSVFLAIIAVSSAISLSACTKKTISSSPLGPVSATGTLIPAESSLVRRGTHLLLENGVKMYYVESKTENLVTYEGQTVHIEGIAEANTGKSDLPVLIVGSVTALHNDSAIHVWEIPVLDLRITTPDAWNAGIVKSVASFLLPGEKTPILTVSVANETALPAGTPFYVANHRAVRIAALAGSGAEEIYLQNKTVILHLHFDASTQAGVTTMEDGKLLQSEFENALSSVQFISDSSNTATGTGSGLVTPCGGVAGVLCPAGYFCDVFDNAAKIGKCRKGGS